MNNFEEQGRYDDSPSLEGMHMEVLHPVIREGLLSLFFPHIVCHLGEPDLEPDSELGLSPRIRRVPCRHSSSAIAIIPVPLVGRCKTMILSCIVIVSDWIDDQYDVNP